MNRKSLGLFSLLLLFALSMIYAWHRMPRKRIASPPIGKTPVTGNQVNLAVKPAMTQPLMFPLPEQPEVLIRRNLFTPLSMIEAAKQAAAAKKKVMQPPPPPPPPTPGDLARRQLANYKTLGMLQHPGYKFAFLSHGGQIVLVQVGDSIVSGYKVTDISDSKLIMGSKEGDEINLHFKKQ